MKIMLVLAALISFACVAFAALPAQDTNGNGSSYCANELSLRELQGGSITLSMEDFEKAMEDSSFQQGLKSALEDDVASNYSFLPDELTDMSEFEAKDSKELAREAVDALGQVPFLPFFTFDDYLALTRKYGSKARSDALNSIIAGTSGTQIVDGQVQVDIKGSDGKTTAMSAEDIIDRLSSSGGVDVGGSRSMLDTIFGRKNISNPLLDEYAESIYSKGAETGGLLPIYAFSADAGFSENSFNGQQGSKNYADSVLFYAFGPATSSSAKSQELGFTPYVPGTGSTVGNVPADVTKDKYVVSFRVKQPSLTPECTIEDDVESPSLIMSPDASGIMGGKSGKASFASAAAADKKTKLYLAFDSLVGNEESAIEKYVDFKRIVYNRSADYSKAGVVFTQGLVGAGAVLATSQVIANARTSYLKSKQYKDFLIETEMTKNLQRILKDAVSDELLAAIKLDYQDAKIFGSMMTIDPAGANADLYVRTLAREYSENAKKLEALLTKPEVKAALSAKGYAVEQLREGWPGLRIIQNAGTSSEGILFETLKDSSRLEGKYSYLVSVIDEPAFLAGSPDLITRLAAETDYMNIVGLADEIYSKLGGVQAVPSPRLAAALEDLKVADWARYGGDVPASIVVDLARTSDKAAAKAGRVFDSALETAKMDSKPGLINNRRLEWLEKKAGVVFDRDGGKIAGTLETMSGEVAGKRFVGIKQLNGILAQRASDSKLVLNYFKGIKPFKTAAAGAFASTTGKLVAKSLIVTDIVASAWWLVKDASCRNADVELPSFAENRLDGRIAVQDAEGKGAEGADWVLLNDVQFDLKFSQSLGKYGDCMSGWFTKLSEFVGTAALIGAFSGNPARDYFSPQSYAKFSDRFFVYSTNPKTRVVASQTAGYGSKGFVGGQYKGPNGQFLSAYNSTGASSWTHISAINNSGIESTIAVYQFVEPNPVLNSFLVRNKGTAKLNGALAGPKYGMTEKDLGYYSMIQKDAQESRPSDTLFMMPNTTLTGGTVLDDYDVAILKMGFFSKSNPVKFAGSSAPVTSIAGKTKIYLPLNNLSDEWVKGNASKLGINAQTMDDFAKHMIIYYRSGSNANVLAAGDLVNKTVGGKQINSSTTAKITVEKVTVKGGATVNTLSASVNKSDLPANPLSISYYLIVGMQETPGKLPAGWPLEIKIGASK